MSAPKAGRQSPDPENQSGAQQQDVPGLGKVLPEYAPPEGDEYSKQSSERTKSELKSNPVHPLEKVQGEKWK